MNLRSLLTRRPTDRLAWHPVIAPEHTSVFRNSLGDDASRHDDHPGYDYSQYADYCHQHPTMLPQDDADTDDEEPARRSAAQESLERLLTPNELDVIRGQRR
ncbi:hypothetical protein [Nocardia callitridis]|uniref:Uncharacterized protein n=1 Tax=Nocardia callitridis TaxID=648753 RepID=A0ABP9K497_9NOCA